MAKLIELNQYLIREKFLKIFGNKFVTFAPKNSVKINSICFPVTGCVTAKALFCASLSESIDIILNTIFRCSIACIAVRYLG